MLVCILYPSKIVDHFTTAKSSILVIFFFAFQKLKFCGFADLCIR